MNKPVFACLLAVSATALCGCQSTQGSVYGATATSGIAHTEPVQFNGQRYQVTFKYQGSFAGYDVTVQRPQKPLANTQNDRASSVEVGTSALSHYACANGQRAALVPGSAAFSDARTWALKARCA